MALTDNVDRRVMHAGQAFTYNVDAAVIIYQGAAVEINASGNAIPAQGTAGVLAGIAMQTVDNTDGAITENRPLIIEREQVELLTVVGAGSSDASINKTVFCTADDAFQLAASTAKLGMIVQYDKQSDRHYVRIRPFI